MSLERDREREREREVGAGRISEKTSRLMSQLVTGAFLLTVLLELF